MNLDNYIGWKSARDNCHEIRRLEMSATAGERRTPISVVASLTRRGGGSCLVYRTKRLVGPSSDSYLAARCCSLRIEHVQPRWSGGEHARSGPLTARASRSVVKEPACSLTSAQCDVRRNLYSATPPGEARHQLADGLCLLENHLTASPALRTLASRRRYL